MAKWMLFISETRHTVFEVEADTPEEGMKICLTDPSKVKKGLGMIEAKIDKAINLTEQGSTVEAAKKFDPLDKSYFSN